MAEKQRSGALSGSMKILTTSAAIMALVVTTPIRALFRDGTLMAAWRQGLHELGNAFGQMLPESITVNEPGGITRPTQGEIAADRRPFRHFYGTDHTIHAPGNGPMSPGEIVRNNQTYDPGQSPEQDNGLEP